MVDLVTGCMHKSNLHTKNLFIAGENVSIDMTNDEIIKPNLPERVFVDKCNNNPNRSSIFCCIIAKPRTDCKTGGGLCDCKVLGTCAPTPLPIDISRNIRVKFTPINQNTQMILEFLDPLPSDVNTSFEFEDDFEIPKPVAIMLNFKKVTIKKELCIIDYNNNPHGKIIVNINSVLK